jgi:hypothetical protein
VSRPLTHLLHLLSFAFLLTVSLGTSPVFAQETDESYDPFADYSEFAESAEQEADINFFRNGRFFTLGFQGGYRRFTETMGSSSVTFLICVLLYKWAF